MGEVDRVTGSARAQTPLATRDGKGIGGASFDLVCKVTNRLF
jgi:hypothetical protein